MGRSGAERPTDERAKYRSGCHAGSDSLCGSLNGTLHIFIKAKFPGTLTRIRENTHLFKRLSKHVIVFMFIMPCVPVKLKNQTK